jgi:phosphatidylserine/phosphatidylglycerophosphate/cardiolipin synthase-like enzyme
MTWLSRGLQEALLAFITTDASPQLVLRAAVYEFTEPSVLAAFADAAAAGADVQIIYHDKPGDSQSTANEKAIADAHLDPAILIARRHTTIAHNKFVVRATRADDGTLTGRQVWTGSTNMSQGGIFGHSNVGHAVRDPAVADAYLAYWTELSTDPTAHPLKTWVSAQSPLIPPGDTPSIHTVFSPRTELAPLDWYAQRFTDSTDTAHITLPFGLDNKHFEPTVAAMTADGPLKFVMLNTRDDHQQVWSRDHAIQVAVGAAGGPDALSRWAKETLTGFNTHVDYLHTKILLIGVLGSRPIIVSGSANFSEASTTSNDENMLIISGDSDAADVYFTEYTRIFQHFYARWWAAQLAHTHHQSATAAIPAGDTPAADPPGTADTAATGHSYLTEDDSWQIPYWNPHSPKSRERDLYANHVGNP